MRRDYKTLKVGDEFYEFGYGISLHLVVTEASKKVFRDINGETKAQWFWKAKPVNGGGEIDYLVTEGLEHYGPSIYYDPDAYVKL